MKKFFMLTAIAMMATVGMSARENARFVAPKTLGEMSKVLLDSSFSYMRTDVKKELATYYTYDEALRQVSCQEFSVDGEKLTISSELRTVYGEDGLKKYEVRFVNYEDEEPMLEIHDSTVYSYDKDMEVSITWMWEEEKWLLSDSMVMLYNAAGKLICETDYIWDTETETPYWKPYELYLYYFDTNNRLDSTVEKAWSKSNSKWEYDRRKIMTYDNSGLRIQDQLELYNRLQMTWSKTETRVYTYDEANVLIADTSYWPSGEGIGYGDYQKYTYDQWGNVSLLQRYDWNENDSIWEHLETIEDFYSEHKIQSAIENVKDSQKSKVESQKYLREGQLYIRRGETIYDAQGQIVE